MTFTNLHLEASAYIFEKENGISHTKYELDIIDKSKLKNSTPEVLKELIINQLEQEKYFESSIRVNAYWALSKINDRNLIDFFRKCLEKELNDESPNCIYQLLICLDNLKEKVFNSDRKGLYSAMDTELNLRDAALYLIKQYFCKYIETLRLG